MAPHATKKEAIFVFLCFVCVADAVRSRRKASADIATLVNFSSIASLKHTSPFRESTVEDYYEKTRLIGKGAAGKVFEAVEKRTQAYKAIKEVESQRYKVVEEEVMGLKLPFVADMDRKFESHGIVSLVTRLYEGDSVRQYTKVHGKVDDGLLKSWGAQMAYGLWALHRKHILYADMKADNTLIVDETYRQVVLSDFGVSRTQCLDTACAKGYRGTPTHCSPAIAKGDPYGYEVDWWAHAVTLFKMATGRYPFVYRGSREEINAKIANAEGIHTLKPIRESHPQLFEYLMRILDKYAYSALENDRTRHLMIGNASKHPFLSDKFWHGLDDPEKIDKHWYELCKRLAIHKEKCVPIKMNQPEELEESDDESDLVDKAACVGCVSFTRWLQGA